MKDIESAIEGLKGIGVILEPLLKRINHEGLGKEDAAELSKHLKMGAEALEKQIPQNAKKNPGASLPPYQCFNGCGLLQEEKGRKHCGHCGQALSWEEIENERI